MSVSQFWTKLTKKMDDRYLTKMFSVIGAKFSSKYVKALQAYLRSRLTSEFESLLSLATILSSNKVLVSRFALRISQ